MSLLKASMLKLLEDFGCDKKCQFAIITAYDMDGEALNGIIAYIKSKGLSYIKIFGLGKDENGKISNVQFLFIKNSGCIGKRVLDDGSEFDRYAIYLGETNGQSVYAHSDLHKSGIVSFLTLLKDKKYNFEYFHFDWSGVDNYLHGMGEETIWKAEHIKDYIFYKESF